MHSLLGGSAVRRGSGRVVALGSTAVLAAAGAGPLVMLTTSTASANAALVVSTLADSGAGSLRQAMLDANSAAGVDTITFTSGLTGTINVLTDLPHLSEGIDLQGPGASVITIDGGWTAAGGSATGHTLFVLDNLMVANGASTISGVTITGGNSTDNADRSGGAIQKLYGDADLTIADVVLTGNYSKNDGGAVQLYGTDGTVTIRDSVISNNVAGSGGGALYSNADNALTLILTNVAITGNTAAANGGGLYLNDTETTISNSTIDGNISSSDGGGIHLYSGSLTITSTTISGNDGVNGGGISGLYYCDLAILNSTISGNGSTGTGTYDGGGGLHLSANVTAVLTQTTVTANTSATTTSSGIQLYGAPASESFNLTLIGAIVAGNNGTDIGITSPAGQSVSADHSVLGVIDPSVTLVNGGGTQTGVTDPKLGLLANNGGVTKTHALLTGSPAIDAGPNPVPVFDGNEFDQRGIGFARIAFGVADAGAFEFQEPPAPEPTTTTTEATTEPVAPAFTG